MYNYFNTRRINKNCYFAGRDSVTPKKAAPYMVISEDDRHRMPSEVGYENSIRNITVGGLHSSRSAVSFDCIVWYGLIWLVALAMSDNHTVLIAREHQRLVALVSNELGREYSLDSGTRKGSPLSILSTTYQLLQLL